MLDDILDKLHSDEWKEEEYNTGFIATKFEPKIINGSTLSIGKDYKTLLKVDQHFNWFQKLMWMFISTLTGFKNYYGSFVSVLK